MIVTYYWPPAGGGGVQRWLKFVKYLSKSGWEPIVYIPENAAYPLEDETLVSEVPDSIKMIGTKIFEPRQVFKKVFKKDNIERKGVKDQLDNLFYIPSNKRKWHQNLAIWVRANFFIPDARKTWVKPSVKYLSSYIQNHQIDTIVTTGPPHSMHLIGLAIKRRYPNTFWIADFRDPWMEIEYFNLLPLTKRSLRKHQSLEQDVLSGADHVITVSPSWAKMFQNKGAENVSVITNGYDPQDFEVQPIKLSDKFRICHVGTLALDRNPKNLWTALSNLIASNQIDKDQLEISFVGKTDVRIINELGKSGLQKSIRDYGYVNHKVSIQMMKQSQLLLLLLNKGSSKNIIGRIPGKVFEYIASGSTILLIGEKNTDVSTIIQKVNGYVAMDDTAEIEKMLKMEYERFLGQTPGPIQEKNLKIYQREYLTNQLINILSRSPAEA